MDLFQAVQVDGTLYISGQLGLDPATANLVSGGVVPQARQAFKNIREILATAQAEFKVSEWPNIAGTVKG